MSDATVYVVDDDTSFLIALARLLRNSGCRVREFTSAQNLLAHLRPEARGCVVTDLWMPGTSGLELQVSLAEAGIVLPILFLTGSADIPSTVQAMRSGAVDLLEKDAPHGRLLTAVGAALARDAAHHATLERTATLRSRFARLTTREREVLEQVVEGRLNKQIAARLGIHERTVKLHRSAIVTKVGVPSAAQIATMARDAHVYEGGRWAIP